MRTTSQGLTVWDLATDSFSYAQLAANWDLINSLLGAASTSVDDSTTVPATGNFRGRLVYLTAADGGFQSDTIIRYDGSSWRAVGPLEVHPTVPTLGNYAGRIVILSAATGGFDQWSVIKFNGTTWELVGGWSNVNTGGGATNIQGLQTAKDVYVNDSARGLVQVDRTTGTKYRVFVDNGTVKTEPVT
jgi:hypothetical protein